MLNMKAKRTLGEKIVLQIDAALRTVCHTAVAKRANPAKPSSVALTNNEKRLAAQCMRVNHAGEIAAQGLYQGQALTARDADIHAKMQCAAEEEIDHLAWCEQRLIELDSHTSYLAAFWYVGSFMIGAVAGVAGDKWSLGFVNETEQQVMAHLDSHLQRLPAVDTRSRDIVTTMREEEAHHATQAINAGAAELPMMIRGMMRMMAKVMTTTARWI